MLHEETFPNDHLEKDGFRDHIRGDILSAGRKPFRSEFDRLREPAKTGIFHLSLMRMGLPQIRYNQDNL